MIARIPPSPPRPIPWALRQKLEPADIVPPGVNRREPLAGRKLLCVERWTIRPDECLLAWRQWCRTWKACEELKAQSLRRAGVTRVLTCRIVSGVNIMAVVMGLLNGDEVTTAWRLVEQETAGHWTRLPPLPTPIKYEIQASGRRRPQTK